MAEAVNLADEFVLPDSEAATATAAPKPSVLEEFDPPDRATQIAVTNDAMEKFAAWSKHTAIGPQIEGAKFLKRAVEHSLEGNLPKLWEDITKPLIEELPRLHAPSLEQTPESMKVMQPTASVLAGAYNTAAGLTESFSSPLSLATLGTFGALTKLAQSAGPAAPIAQKLLAALKLGFAADMGVSTAEQIKPSAEILANPDSTTQQKTEAILAPAATAAMAILSGAHGIKDVTEIRARGAASVTPVAGVVVEAAPTPTPEPAAPTPEIERLKQTPGGEDKLASIQELIKKPETVIQYSVWDREMIPEGKDRVAQVDLIDPNNPQPGGNGSTNRAVLQELGVDAPPAPEWLKPGAYTLDEIKAEIAKGPPRIADEFAPPEGVAEDKPLVGLGAASPEEFKPVREREMGIKNAMVDEQRAARGQPPLMEPASKAFGKSWDEAMSIISEDQNAPDTLIAELKDKPRALRDVEQAMLEHRYIELNNEFDRLTKRLDEKTGSEVTLQSDELRRTQVLEELNDLELVNKQSGSTETARGLSIRRAIAKEDFSLAKMLTKRRVAKGGAKLTPEEESQVREQHAEVEEAQRALDEHEAQAELDAAITTPEEAAARIAQLEETEIPKGASDKRLAALKRRTQKRIDDLRKKIETGDFSKPERIPIEKDAEANRLQAELDTAKEEFNKALERDHYEQLTGIQKVRENAANLYDAARNIMTTGELSFLRRQGGFSFLTNPVISAKAVPKSMQALLTDPITARALDMEVFKHPDYAKAKAAKLHLVREGEKLSVQDEAFASKWADRVPFLRNFNQSGRVFLNKLRFDVWRAMREGRDNLTPQEDAALATFVNESTGRGGLGKFEGAALLAGRILFSPRYLMSRIQLAVGHSMWGGTLRTRMIIGRQYAKALVSLGAYYSLLRLWLESNDDKKPKPTIGIDATSSDFGKVKIGNTRLDPLSGLSQVIVFGARTEEAARAAAMREIGMEPPKKKGREVWTDTALRFGRSKLHPVPASIADLFNGTDLVGHKTDLKTEAIGMVYPMTYQDIYQALEEQDLPEGVSLSLLALMGEGLQTYKPTDKKKKQMGQPNPPQPPPK